MAQKDNKIRPGKDMRRAGAPADKSLAVALIKLMGVGFATGLALIAGAKKVGDTYLDAKEISELPDIEDMEGMGEDDGADVEAEAEAEFEAVEEVAFDAEAEFGDAEVDASGFEPEGGMN